MRKRRDGKCKRRWEVFFVIRPDNRNLNYDAYMEKGHKNIQDIKEYNSENTKRLSLKEMTSLLEKYGQYKLSNERRGTYNWFKWVCWKNLLIKIIENGKYDPLKFNRGDSLDFIEQNINQIKLIVHLAAENRSDVQEDFKINNIDLTQNVVILLESKDLKYL